MWYTSKKGDEKIYKDVLFGEGDELGLSQDNFWKERPWQLYFDKYYRR